MRKATSFAVSLATLTMIVAASPVTAESADTKSVATTSSANGADVSASESVLAEQLKKVDAAILEALKQAGEKYRSTIGWELTLKTLPSRDKVLQTKDAASFREYCGLAEIYLFMDKVDDAEALRLWVEKNATEILGAGDVHPKLISSDFGLYYYGHEDYKKAVQMFDHCIKSMEEAIATNPAIVKNQLISAYAAMAEISWKTARKADAAKYVQKVIALSSGAPTAAPPTAAATPAAAASAAPATPSAAASAAPATPSAAATPAAQTVPTAPTTPPPEATSSAPTTTPAPATPALPETSTAPTAPASSTTKPAEGTSSPSATPSGETTPTTPVTPAAPATAPAETNSTSPATPALPSKASQ